MSCLGVFFGRWHERVWSVLEHYWDGAYRRGIDLYSSQHQEGLRLHVGGGRFPDPRLRDEDPGVRCSPALRA